MKDKRSNQANQATVLPELLTGDLEEAFVSALGWAMQEQGAGRTRLDYSRYISEGLVVGEGEILDPRVRSIYQAVREIYVQEGPAFSWAQVLWKLIRDHDSEPLSLLAEVVINDRGTVSSLPVLARLIHSASERRTEVRRAQSR